MSPLAAAARKMKFSENCLNCQKQAYNPAMKKIKYLFPTIFCDQLAIVNNICKIYIIKEVDKKLLD